MNNIRYFLDRKFVLGSDIALNELRVWTMIGSESQPFTGQINGAGHTISGITYSENANSIAFIHTLGVAPKDGKEYNTTDGALHSAKIYNIGFDINIPSNYKIRTQYFGGIAINNYGTIDNVNISGSVYVFLTTSSENLYGGAVANNYSVIDNVVSTMSVIVSRDLSQTTQYSMVGGVAAVNYGLITKSGNSGSLKGQYVGGIVADNYNLITLSYNRGSLEAVSDSYDMAIFAGGIAARNIAEPEFTMVGKIQTCYSVFNALVGSKIAINSEKSAYYGGIVAQTHFSSTANIDSCYAIINTDQSDIVGLNITGASLIGVVLAATNGWYGAINKSYACSNVSSFITNNNDAKVTSQDLITYPASYNGKITNVTSLSASQGLVTITNISINASYLPVLNWEAAEQ